MNLVKKFYPVFTYSDLYYNFSDTSTNEGKGFDNPEDAYKFGLEKSTDQTRFTNEVAERWVKID